MRTLSLAIVLTALSACQVLEPGPKVLETRPTAPFTRIELLGSTDLHVQVGVPAGLTVRAPEDSIGEIVTEVRDGTLVVRPAEGSSAWWDAGDVAVTVPRLESLYLAGSSDAALEGFEGGTLRITLGGSGRVGARGWVDRLEVNGSGTGSIDLGDLAAEEASVTLEGSGDAVVWAEALVEIDVTGTGDVYVKGRPAVSRVVTAGTGQVSAE